MTIPIRPPFADDLPAILALNNASAVETPALTPDSLRHLIASAFHVRLAGETEGFCLALDQTASYDSPNFYWFLDRLKRFVYVDRVVVAAHARGRGIARALYRDLAVAARASGHAALCCEVNTEPANPASDRFHDAYGFVTCGRAVLKDRAKTVRYLLLTL